MLGTVHDIEQLLRLGRETHACPYYSTRLAIPPAQVLTFPSRYLLRFFAAAPHGLRVFSTVGGVALPGAASRGHKKSRRGPAEGTGKILFSLSFVSLFFFILSFLLFLNQLLYLLLFFFIRFLFVIYYISFLTFFIIYLSFTSSFYIYRLLFVFHLLFLSFLRPLLSFSSSSSVSPCISLITSFLLFLFLLNCVPSLNFFFFGFGFSFFFLPHFPQ